MAGGRRVRWSAAIPRSLVVIAAASVALYPTLAQAHVPGRMTGGGSVFTNDGTRVRVTHGFEIHCISPEGSDPIEPNNLEINWEGNQFHLEQLTQGVCFDDPNLNPGQPDSPFDTFRGAGFGRYNGVSGASIVWTFTDNAEPGHNDQARITIWDVNGDRVLKVPLTVLDKGNHQAHAS